MSHFENWLTWFFINETGKIIKNLLEGAKGAKASFQILAKSCVCIDALKQIRTKNPIRKKPWIL